MKHILLIFMLLPGIIVAGEESKKAQKKGSKFHVVEKVDNSCTSKCSWWWLTCCLPGCNNSGLQGVRIVNEAYEYLTLRIHTNTTSHGIVVQPHDSVVFTTKPSVSGYDTICSGRCCPNFEIALHQTDTTPTHFTITDAPTELRTDVTTPYILKQDEIPLQALLRQAIRLGSVYTIHNRRNPRPTKLTPTQSKPTETTALLPKNTEHS